MTKATGISIFSLIICFFHPLCTFAQSNVVFLNHLQGEVGEIKFDDKLDKRNFQICHPGYIFQYYAFNTAYSGGKRGIEHAILKKWPHNPLFSSVNGLVTVRFVVNCEGQSDRFRVLELDNHYNKTHLNHDFIKRLLAITKSLRAWQPGKLPDGRPVDSYYYLTFRIANGKLKQLMP